MEEKKNNTQIYALRTTANREDQVMGFHNLKCYEKRY